MICLGAMSILALGASGQQSSPCISVERNEEGVIDYYEVRLQEIFSDSLYASARSHHSLATLTESEPSTVWSASGTNCRNLLQDAVDAINAERGTTRRWQDTDYIVVDIGPYRVFVDQSTQGLFRAGVVFDAAADSVVAIIPMN